MPVHEPPAGAGNRSFITMRCSTVQILGSGISQIEKDGAALTIPKDEITQITLCYDPKTRHPFLHFLAGFGLVTTGLVFLIAAFILAEGGVYTLQIKSLIFRIPFAPLVLWAMVGIGLWILLGVFRGRYNFLIKTGKGNRKIFFPESTDIREIRQFVERAHRELGYDIDVSIMDTMHF